MVPATGQMKEDTDPPKKHSEEFFAARIQTLRSNIEEQIPSVDDSAALQGFLNVCKALEAAGDSKKKAEDLLDSLQKDKENPNADAIKKAQDLVDACQQTIANMWNCEKDVGKWAMETLDLVSLEDTLTECTILVQSTPKGLAEFCAIDEGSHGRLLDEFLGNGDWMKSMVRHGGASNGNYGRAILIHSKLLAQISDNNSTEVRRKLALAVALEFARDIAVFHDDETCIDPIERFWHYANAYENGELDKAFENLTVWELRLVIDSDAPNDALKWGREYLKAYRPDEVLSTDDRWKYLWAVRTDINYHKPEHDFSTYQELLSAGGVCGARAWFGRFITKSFGMPTWGVRQPGHAAIARWTPGGWVTVLGAGFQHSYWTDNRYTGGEKNLRREGVDFEEETKARKNACPKDYYEKMSLLECLAESKGETVEGEINSSKVWRSLSLVQRRIFAQQEEEEEVDKYNNSHSSETNHDDAEEPPRLVEDQQLTKEEPYRDRSGCFVIPASSFANPPSESLLVMPSFLGGLQLHCTSSQIFLENDDGGGSMEYEIPRIIPPGTYTLTCHVVSVHRRQVPLVLQVENFDDSNDTSLVDVQSIDIPYTVGKWEKTQGVRVQLRPGGLLKFSRESPCHGLSIKEFVLERLSMKEFLHESSEDAVII